MTMLAGAAPAPRHTLFRRAAAIVAVAATAFLAACASLGVGAAPVPPPPAIGPSELRISTPAEGKEAELDARFRDHTIGLFRKHGMTPVGFFHVKTAANAPADNRLIYIMGYKDRAARDAPGRSFAGDQAWVNVYAPRQARRPLTMQIENDVRSPTDAAP